MKKIAYLLSLLSLLGCKTIANETKVIETEKPQEPIINYFMGSGNEPFWNLSIAENQIEFTSLIEGFENIKTPHVEPVRAMDANVKMYKVETKTTQLIIQIFQSECVDSMSGKVSKYKIKVDIKHTADDDYKSLEGCGSYTTDYRLTDIWVLEELKGSKVTATDFMRELPLIEINTKDDKFFGYAGCNRMNGTLFFEKGIIRFTNIITTKMMCQEKNKENEFLQALQSTTTYKIENNRLWLSNSNGLQVVFKKVD